MTSVLGTAYRAQSSTLLRYQDAVSLCSKLNKDPDTERTYIVRDLGNGRGVIEVRSPSGLAIDLL